MVTDYFQEHFWNDDNNELLQMIIADEMDEIRVSLQGANPALDSGQMPSTDDIDNLPKRVEYINQRFIAAAESCELLPSVEDMREYAQAAVMSSNMKTEQDFWNAFEQLGQDGCWGEPEGKEFSSVLAE